MQDYAIAIAILAAIGSRQALAQNDCCAECGARVACCKVCRLVCKNTKVDVVCYGYACEDFCIPGPSRPKCDHCDMLCAQCDAESNCDPGAPRSLAKHFRWTSWFAGDAKLYTRKKLMKKTVTKTVPTYKWVVEDICCQCKSGFACVEVATDEEDLPAREIDALLLAPMKPTR